MFDFNINGTAASSVGVYAIRRPNIPTPKRRISLITVPGADGAFTDDEETYEPIQFDIECNFMSKTPDTFADEARAVRQWLYSQQRSELIFSDDTEFFYKTQIILPSDIERTSNRIGVFTISVTCNPYTYLSSGKEEIQLSSGITNPTAFIAKPIYKFSGSGRFQITVGTYVLIYDFAITVSESATVDTELMLAYDSDGESIINNLTRGDFNTLWLNPGSNSIKTFVPSGGSISMIPRWRTI